MRFALASLALGASLLGLGCAPEPVQDLLEVTGPTSQVIESNQEFGALGEAFPPGESATIHLAGQSLGPGREPRSVDLILPGGAISMTRIVTKVPPATLGSLLAGSDHATFRGTLSVEFAPRRPGGSPLRGERAGVVLDVYAPQSKAAVSTPFVEFLGIQVSDRLEVQGVAPSGPAAEAGLAPGDRLVELDGHHLDNRSDLEPRPGEATAILQVRGAAAAPRTVLINRSAYQPEVRTDLAKVAGALLGLVFGILVALRPRRNVPAKEDAGRLLGRQHGVSGSHWTHEPALALFAGLLLLLLARACDKSGLPVSDWGALLVLTFAAGLRSTLRPKRQAPTASRWEQTHWGLLGLALPALSGFAMPLREGSGALGMPWLQLGSAWSLAATTAAIGGLIALWVLSQEGNERPFTLLVALLWVRTSLPVGWPSSYPLTLAMIGTLAALLHEGLRLLRARAGTSGNTLALGTATWSLGISSVWLWHAELTSELTHWIRLSAPGVLAFLATAVILQTKAIQKLQGPSGRALDPWM